MRNLETYRIDTIKDILMNFNKYTDADSVYNIWKSISKFKYDHNKERDYIETRHNMYIVYYELKRRMIEDKIQYDTRSNAAKYIFPLISVCANKILNNND